MTAHFERRFEQFSAPVAEALRRMLPNAETTLLLRAALDGDHGAGAWQTWRARHDLQATLASDRVGVKGMLPLLAYALARDEAIVIPDDLSLLRMARYRESLRSARYQEILHGALTTLAVGGVPLIVLKGAALANAAYPAPALRHNHDIDLLIQPHDMTRAADLLLAHNFHAPGAATAHASSARLGSLRLDHASGLPVMLHTRLFRHELCAPPLDEAWRDAQLFALGEVDSSLLTGQGKTPERPPQCAPLRERDERAQLSACKMLAPEWELIHILGGVLDTRARVTWVCDAYFLLVANPSMDWVRVCELAVQSRLTMVAYVLLGYLQQQHRLPIPQALFDELSRNFSPARRANSELILQSARHQGVATYGDLLAAATSWQECAFLLRWMLVPLPTTMQHHAVQQHAVQQHDEHGWQMRFRGLRFYLLRGLRYVARRGRGVATKPFRRRL